MTVGQELAKITGLRLFHNHMSIELARKLFVPNEKEEFQSLNRAIRQKVFDLFATRDEGYKKLRSNQYSANNVEEKPALFSLSPELTGKSVLDFGCGCRHL